jgi:hypothetical protein
VSKHPTTVTYLAMDAPFPKSGDAVTWPPGTQFLSLDQMPLDDYRKLYDSVGRDWHWVNRRHLTDAQLAGIIHHPATQIRVLHRGPKPIGFVELNMKQFPEVEIVFIGLVRLEIGLGLGQLMVPPSKKASACWPNGSSFKPARSITPAPCRYIKNPAFKPMTKSKSLSMTTNA